MANEAARLIRAWPPSGGLARLKRAVFRRPRVFIGLTEIAGHYRGTSRGLCELGAAPLLCDLSPDPFGYSGRRDPHVALWRALRRAAEDGGRPRAGRLVAALAERVVAMAMLARVALTCEGAILVYTSAFLRGHREERWLRRLGVELVRHGHGSDGRPAYLDGPTVLNVGGDARTLVALAAAQEAEVLAMTRHATAVVAHPPTMPFARRAIVPFVRVGVASGPAHPPAEVPPPPANREVVRLLHAPSLAPTKGTAAVRAIVERLRDEGLPVALVEIQGRPNQEVLAELERCDLAIDQVWADLPVVGVSVEAAWLGRPTLCGGDAGTSWTAGVAEDEVLPLRYVAPEALEPELKALVADRLAREALGAAAGRFVREQMRPRDVAARYLTLLSGHVPPDWLLDPRDVVHPWGTGMPREQVREVVAAVVSEGGSHALRLDHHPALRDALLGLASS